LAAVAAQADRLKELGVEVIAISTDTHFSHWMWKKTSPTIKKVKFAMASDPSGAVSRAYGVWNEKSGLNQRGRFIINPEGVVMGVEVLMGSVGRNVEELIRQIQAMQAVKANPGMAAPAGWKPGDELIKTGKEQIGKY
jgi:alkyl hydroperoxide reductase subunit AhpC